MEEKELQEEAVETEVGEVLTLVADEDNPIGDGLEFKEGEE